MTLLSKEKAMDNPIESFYPQIGQLIISALPNFSEAWVSIEMIDNVWGAEAFFRDPNNQIRYSNEGLVDIERAFLEMRKAVKLLGKEPFTTATFLLTDAGKFYIDFGYEDVSDFGLSDERRKAWIEKYLGDDVQIQWN
jgi:Protein of unknown function, DUF600